MLLEIPADRYLASEEIGSLKKWIVKDYAALSDRSFKRDIDELLELGLLDKNKNTYRAKIEILKSFMAVRPL
ncbi:MAG: hypothetical protein GY754_13645 [bacterium]|nr:hypothetical protein [bacterium]